MQGLQKIPITFSEKMRNILYNILTKHIDFTPTPLSLCDQLGIAVPGNSFYKHSPHHYIDFNPFSNTMSKSKIFDDVEEKIIPIPDLEALDRTMHYDLQKSKMIGTEYRKKNNFVISCDYYGKTVRPYRNNLLVQPDHDVEESVILPPPSPRVEKVEMKAPKLPTPPVEK